MEEKRREAGTLPPANTESPTTEPASSKRRGGAQKRKANSLNSSNSTPTPSKRLTREKAQLSHPPIHNGPLTRARQAPNNVTAAASTSVAGAAASDSAVRHSELAVKKECSGAESVAAEEELNKESVREALEAALEAEYEAIRSRDDNVHVVPNHCGWFSWGAIHPIEERMLPAFFNGKTENRSPDIYMEIRDWIMRKFQESPNAHIALKDLSELDVGSLDAKQEVMEFLDYWGLINFHPFPSADPTMAHADDDGAAQKNSILEKLYHFETQLGHQPPTPKALTPKSSVMAPAVSSGLFPDPSIAEELIKPEGPSVEYHCNSCSADCSRKRYHCQKQADFDLCFDCFSNGKFDSDMSSSDFILMESAEAPGLSGGKWTDQETLLLLEALELYRENWNEIAEHVATKTKAQCILHFLQMPIEDAFLNYDDHSDSSSKQPTDAPEINTQSSVKEANETKENNTIGDEDQVPIPTETSKGDNVNEVKVSEETLKADDAVVGKTSDESSQPEDYSEAKISRESTEDCAFKALTEAFEAIGYVPGPDGPHSFGEVGNPVMALAIFLGRLVGSDVAFSSSHASLKSMCGNSPSLELAARNCFLLEDPPTGRDHQKCIEVDEKNEKQVVSNSASDELSNNHCKKIDRTDEDKKLPISPRMESSETPHTVRNDKEVGLENLREIMKQSDNSASVVAQASLSPESGGTSIKGPAQPKEQNCAEESNLPSDKNEHQSSISEKASLDQSGSLEVSKHVELMLESGPLENNKSQKLQSSDSAAAESFQPMDADILAHSLQLKNEQDPKVSNKPSQEQKSKETVDSTLQSYPLESNDLSQPVRLSSMIKTGDNGGDGPEEESNQVQTECTKPNKSEKVKRAAVSVLTAAAVKAKVLADSEEDQIRQLTALLIEKQLHKLEAKLAFFNDMENVVMRARENLDRTRQKLYHERAQIIASRLGLPPSSSRLMPPSFPTNRIPMNYTNSIPRPSMIMPPQRPPLSKPMGTMFSTPPNPLPSATTIGNMARLASQDKFSSGTK